VKPKTEAQLTECLRSGQFDRLICFEWFQRELPNNDAKQFVSEFSGIDGFGIPTFVRDDDETIFRLKAPDDKSVKFTFGTNHVVLRGAGWTIVAYYPIEGLSPTGYRDEFKTWVTEQRRQQHLAQEKEYAKAAKRRRAQDPARNSKFVLLLFGCGHGCDHTIGCNQRIIPLKAKDWDSAQHAAIKTVFAFGTSRIEDAVVLEVAQRKSLNLTSLKEKRDAKRKKAAEKVQRAKDEAELERLQRKLGKRAD
jgi:hypothetical protein